MLRRPKPSGALKQSSKNGDWLHRPKPGDDQGRLNRPNGNRPNGAWTVLPVPVFQAR